MVRISLMVMKRRRIIEREILGLLADFSLERGKGGCLTAFVLDGFLQRRPEIFDRPKGSDARGVGSMGTNLTCCCRKSRVLFTMWALARYICP